MGKKKSTSKSSTNQTTTSAPPSWTLPGLEQVAQQTTNAAAGLPTDFYQGDLVAQYDPAQVAAIQAAWGNTANLAGDMTGFLQDNLGNLTYRPDWAMDTGDMTGMFNMGNMADVNPVINASLAPVLRNLQENILPSLQSSADQSGAYSNNRAFSVLPGQALHDFSTEAGNIAATIGYQNYADYENRRLQAWEGDMARRVAAYQAETQRGLGEGDLYANQAGMLPDYINSILKTSASQGDLMKMMMDLGMTADQAAIGNATARDTYDRTMPFVGLDSAASILQALSGNYGTQHMEGKSKTTQTQSGGLAGQLIQGALGLGMAAMGMPGGLGAMFGAGAGAAAPVAASAASSLFNPQNPGVGY